MDHCDSGESLKEKRRPYDEYADENMNVDYRLTRVPMEEAFDYAQQFEDRHPSAAAAACDSDDSTGGETSDNSIDLDYDSGDDRPTFCCDTHRVPSVIPRPPLVKEERKRLARMSMRKLRAIEDHELFLRRSVLINNTLRIIQRPSSAARASHTADRVSTSPLREEKEEEDRQPSFARKRSSSSGEDPQLSPQKRDRREELDAERLRYVPCRPDTPPPVPYSSADSDMESPFSSLLLSSVSSSPCYAPSPSQSSTTGGEDGQSHSSCRQFSLFGQLNSVVFHSLITSLES